MLGKATIKLHTRLRKTLGKDQIEINLDPDSDLKSLLGSLSKEYPKLENLLKGEFGYKHLMILINNNHIGAINEEVLKRRINDGDTLSILEPTAAG